MLDTFPSPGQPKPSRALANLRGPWSPRDDFWNCLRCRGRIGSFVSTSPRATPQSAATAPPPRTLQQLTAAFSERKKYIIN